MAIPQTFVWGAGGAQLTPDQIARRRQIADALGQRAGDYSPVGHWTQGMARVAAGLRSGIENWRADKAETEGRESATAAFEEAIGAPEPSGGSASPPVSEGDFAIPESYYDATRMSESGGDPNARNPNSSATGPFQFLEGTWNDLARDPSLGLTPDGRTDPAQSERAMRAFTQKNAGALVNAGLPTTPGNLYAAHFLGAGGAVPVLQAPDDAPMTSLVSPEVMAANPHLQGMTARDFRSWTERNGTRRAPGNQTAQAGGGIPARGPGGIDPRLIAAASNPHLTDAQRGVVNAIIGQQIKAGQPKDLMEVNGRIFDPNTNRVVQDFSEQKAPKTAEINGQTVEWTGQGWRPVVVPGGAPDPSDARKAQTERAADIVITDIGRARNAMENKDGWLPTTGAAGVLASMTGGTAAADLKATLETIKANVGFDRLQQMREASPTGGALGSVSENENRLLQSVLGSLEQSQTKEQLDYNLKRLENIYNDIVHGPGNGPERHELVDPYANDGWKDAGNGVRIREKR